MRKKRKGSELLCVKQKEDLGLTGALGSVISNVRTHFSLEDYARLNKRCKENVESGEDVVSGRVRVAGIAATAPACATSSSSSSGRGIKRKIGCIDVATQMGRKDKIEDDYISGATIGKGKFGSVWLCRSKVTEEDFACKTLVKGEEIVHREVEIMQHLSGHPGVVTLKAVYEDPESFHLVMELCSGGRLIDQMTKQEKYSEQRAANIFKDLMAVIKYCHEMGVVHRDIKPENILLTNSGKIKLADFGLAMRITNDQKLNGVAGSPAYVAPEILSGNYSEKVDVWSAGVLLYALLTGVLPFKGDSLEAVFEAIKTVKLDFHAEIWETVSKPARDLLERILTRDPAARITAEEVLTHPWILCHTERTLRTLSIKSKTKSQPGSHQLQSTTSIPDPNRKIREINFVDDNTSQDPSSESLSHERDQPEESDLVDALAVAVSRVTISEPKRSRLCSPTSPIREQCSSNVTSNNLCKAF